MPGRQRVGVDRRRRVLQDRGGLVWTQRPGLVFVFGFGEHGHPRRSRNPPLPVQSVTRPETFNDDRFTLSSGWCVLRRRTCRGSGPRPPSRRHGVRLRRRGPGADAAQEAAAIAAAETDVYATVGVHPHDTAEATEAHWEVFERLARAPKVVGIGETGLDYHYEHSPPDVQRAAYRRSIAPRAGGRAAGRLAHPGRARGRGRDPARGSGRHGRGHPLLHRRRGRGPRLSGSRPVPVVFGDRHLQERRRPSAKRPRSRRPSASWSRPTPPIWRPSPTAASGTSRPSSPRLCGSWPSCGASPSPSWTPPRPQTPGGSSVSHASIDGSDARGRY